MAIETSMQNAGLAIIIIATSFPQEIADEVIGVPIIYQMLNTLVSILFLSILFRFKWTGKKGDGGGSPICCSTFPRMPCYTGEEEEQEEQKQEEEEEEEILTINGTIRSSKSSDPSLPSGVVSTSSQYIDLSNSGHSISEVEFSSTPAGVGTLDGSRSQKADR